MLQNDTDADGDTLSVTNLSQPTNGTASLNGDHNVHYLPDSDFTGEDSFTYQAYDGKHNSNIATVTVTVNAAPLANDDAVSTIEGVGVIIDVLSNDTDADSETLSVTELTQPSSGTGLGLAMAMDIVQGHSGSIRVESCVVGENGSTDSGTSFIISCPISQPVPGIDEEIWEEANGS